MTRQTNARLLYLIFLLALPMLALTSEDQPRIFLIGDSTMADKAIIGNPERGWGEELPLFFTKDVVIENHARNGRSTKSFITEGRWAAVYGKLKPGDYVFIQFGHNDAKKEDTSRYAQAHTDYKTNLLRFVNDTRSKGAFPVLMTPVSRRHFDENGKLVDTHGDYPGVVRELAAEQKVPLIDLHRKSMQLLEKLGAEDSKKIYDWAKPDLFTAARGGKKDDTHFNTYGAVKMAGLVVESIKELNLPLGASFLPFDEKSLVGLDKIVCLDYFYNNEWRKDAKGRSVRFHYVWEDSTNSGFSILGGVIARLGASIDSVCEAPSLQRLKKASIYIIVDPDTPLETEHPNYVEAPAIDAIDEWVKDGGVLVLMENDKGNAEFEHFNHLAARFGIQFNEDSRNKVTGDAYDMGKFDSFPDHLLFKGVRQIYMKEISTLKIQKPAIPLFTDHGDVIIAYAAVGKGAVFAVGDPWLYDEYITHRKLPQAYENDKAAENLFRWLLEKSLPVPAN
jgi:lysophospholipase L1-like esterase